MKNMEHYVTALDARFIFDGLEHLAVILLITIAAAVVFEKTTWFSHKLKLIIWTLIVLLAISLVAQYIAELYAYTSGIRPVYESVRR